MCGVNRFKAQVSDTEVCTVCPDGSSSATGARVCKCDSADYAMDETAMKCKNSASGAYYSKPLTVGGLSVLNLVLIILGGIAGLFVLGLMWRALTTGKGAGPASLRPPANAYGYGPGPPLPPPPNGYMGPPPGGAYGGYAGGPPLQPGFTNGLMTAPVSSATMMYDSHLGGHLGSEFGGGVMQRHGA